MLTNEMSTLKSESLRDAIVNVSKKTLSTRSAIAFFKIRSIDLKTSLASLIEYESENNCELISSNMYNRLNIWVLFHTNCTYPTGPPYT